MSETELSVTNKEKLLADMRGVIADAEEILRVSAGTAGDKMGEIRERVEERLRDARVRLADAEVLIVEKTKAAAVATDDFVQDHPWKAVGVAAAVGLALGVLIGRR